MQDGKKLAYYFVKYANSLQAVIYTKTGNYFHDNNFRPVRFVYLCPLCAKNTISYTPDGLRFLEPFTLDHFPPSNVEGKNTVLVCNRCNSTSGHDFDHALKTWLNDKCAALWIPGTTVPVKIKLDNTKGNYKGNLIVNGSYSLKYDFSSKYILLDEGLRNVAKGEPAIQTLTFPQISNNLTYKAILKAAYLYAFSIWGYDFVISYTGKKIRDILFMDEKHILSNFGVFFHMKLPFPPIGLCYVYKPVELQSFLINLRLINPDVKFECSASVLIPGPEQKGWDGLSSYQAIINKKASFQNALIKLPENELCDNNYFPYTRIWNNRHQFRIQGEAL